MAGQSTRLDLDTIEIYRLPLQRKRIVVEKGVYSQLVLHTKKRFLVLQVQATATASLGRENKAIVEIIGT